MYYVPVLSFRTEALQKSDSEVLRRISRVMFEESIPRRASVIVKVTKETVSVISKPEVERHKAPMLALRGSVDELKAMIKLDHDLLSNQFSYFNHPEKKLLCEEELNDPLYSPPLPNTRLILDALLVEDHKRLSKDQMWLITTQFEGGTLLHYACINNQHAAIQYLLEAGIDQRVKNVGGQIASDYLSNDQQSFATKQLLNANLDKLEDTPIEQLRKSLSATTVISKKDKPDTPLTRRSTLLSQVGSPVNRKSQIIVQSFPARIVDNGDAISVNSALSADTIDTSSRNSVSSAGSSLSVRKIKRVLQSRRHSKKLEEEETLTQQTSSIEKVERPSPKRSSKRPVRERQKSTVNFVPSTATKTIDMHPLLLAFQKSQAKPPPAYAIQHKAPVAAPRLTDEDEEDEENEEKEEEEEEGRKGKGYVETFERKERKLEEGFEALKNRYLKEHQQKKEEDLKAFKKRDEFIDNMWRTMKQQHAELEKKEGFNQRQVEYKVTEPLIETRQPFQSSAEEKAFEEDDGNIYNINNW